MRVIDKETPEERQARRKRGIKYAIRSVATLAISALAVRSSFDVEGGLRHLLFLGGLFGFLMGVQFLFDGVWNALLPNFSIAFIVIFVTVLISAYLIYLGYFSESGEAK